MNEVIRVFDDAYPLIFFIIGILTYITILRIIFDDYFNSLFNYKNFTQINYNGLPLSIGLDIVSSLIITYFVFVDNSNSNFKEFYEYKVIVFLVAIYITLGIYNLQQFIFFSIIKLDHITSYVSNTLLFAKIWMIIGSVFFLLLYHYSKLPKNLLVIVFVAFIVLSFFWYLFISLKRFAKALKKPFYKILYFCATNILFGVLVFKILEYIFINF